MNAIIYAGLAIPDADAPTQTDYAVYVEGHRIADVGTRAALIARYPEAEQFGSADYLLMPSFINSHDHGRAVGSASLGIPDDLLEIWLPMLSGQPAIPPYLAAAYDAIQLLKAGVGTTAHSHNPLAWADLLPESRESIRGYQAAGIRVAFHPPLIDQNPLVYADREAFIAALPPDLQLTGRAFTTPVPISAADYIGLCTDLYQAYHDADNHTVHVQISPAGGQWCSDALIMASVGFARQHQTRVQMHMLETRYQRIYAFKTWGQSFIRHLDELGALGPWLTLAHMVYVDEADMALLADRRVAIAHNPSSNLRLRSGIAPIAKMCAAGIPVGIGLDGHALDDDQDYLREMRLAWTLANQPGAASASVTGGQILAMGTSLGAAVTLGDDVPIGRLVPGQLADLVLIDWPALRGDWAPVGYVEPAEVPAHLLHRASRRHVRHVMVDGRWVVRDGLCITLDEAMIASAMRDTLAAQNPDDRRARRRAAAALAPHLRQFYAGWD
jgi:cytosine/adenosine deaminase-related metal-dependent hydrolase